VHRILGLAGTKSLGDLTVRFFLRAGEQPERVLRIWQ
jgi:hypothetical protein